MASNRVALRRAIWQTRRRYDNLHREYNYVRDKMRLITQKIDAAERDILAMQIRLMKEHGEQIKVWGKLP